MYARPTFSFLLGLALAAAGAIPAFAQADPAAQANAQACQQEFETLKADLEKKGEGLKTAGQRKASAQEVCQLLRRFTETEAKLIKFFEQKMVACQVPNQIVKQAKDGHVKAIAMRTQVCQVAAGGGAEAPPPPSMGLSGALGTSSTLGGSPEGTTSGSGVFDTLTGNVLRQ
jgi:hypothetical protein